MQKGTLTHEGKGWTSHPGWVRKQSTLHTHCGTPRSKRGIGARNHPIQGLSKLDTYEIQYTVYLFLERLEKNTGFEQLLFVRASADTSPCPWLTARSEHPVNWRPVPSLLTVLPPVRPHTPPLRRTSCLAHICLCTSLPPLAICREVLPYVGWLPPRSHPRPPPSCPHPYPTVRPPGSQPQYRRCGASVLRPSRRSCYRPGFGARGAWSRDRDDAAVQKPCPDALQRVLQEVH